MGNFGKVVLTLVCYGVIKAYGKIKYWQGQYDLTMEVKQHLKEQANDKPHVKYKRYSSYAPGTETTYVTETRGEAEALLNSINECIQKFGFVTIADLKSLCNMNYSYNDELYGWTTIRFGYILNRKNGCEVKLPAPIRLDKEVRN